MAKTPHVLRALRVPPGLDAEITRQAAEAGQTRTQVMLERLGTGRPGDLGWEAFDREVLRAHCASGSVAKALKAARGELRA